MRPILYAGLLLSLVVGVSRTASAQPEKVVGYYPSWARYTYPYPAVAYENLTHIAHAFIWPRADGTLEVPSDFLYPQLVETAQARGVRVVVAVGGWGQSAGFAPMAADGAARARFVQNVVDFCLTHRYDGVDLDWEYPAAQDRDNLVALVQELRAAFDSTGRALTISAALPAGDWSGGYDIQRLHPNFDWAGIMTYDFHGSWTSHSGHNSPLFPHPSDQEGSIAQSIANWLGKGLPASKLNIGIPFYGRVFNSTALYAASSGGASSLYPATLDRIAEGWTYHWDAASSVPYLRNPAGNQLISFDDTASVRIKAEYAKQRGLNGVIIWALGQDYREGQGAPLLDAVGTALLAAGTPVEEKPVAPGSALLSARPNPFTTTVAVPFEVAAPGPVRIEVYSLLGRKVATLTDRSYAPGEYELTWDARSVPDGVYVCRMEAGGAVQVRKLTRVR